jgi:hypothetical protein
MTGLISSCLAHWRCRRHIEYQQLFATTDVVSGKVTGGLYDVNGQPLMDTSDPNNVIQYVSDTPYVTAKQCRRQRKDGLS